MKTLRHVAYGMSGLSHDLSVKARLLWVAAGLMLVAPNRAMPATWSGGGADDNWSTPENWQDGIVPTNGEALVFSGTERRDTINDLLTCVGLVTFAESGFSVCGENLTLADGIRSVGTNMWDINSVLASDQSFTCVSNGLLTVNGTLDNGGYELTVNGEGDTLICGTTSGEGDLIKSDAGVLTITSVNGYTGRTSVNGGTLRLDNAVMYTPSFTLNRSTLDLVDGALALGSGQTIEGKGTVKGNMMLASGSAVAPGGSVGRLDVDGAMTLQGGGVYECEINDATGTAGVDSGWDLLAVTGTLIVAATRGDPFIVRLVSLVGTADGSAVNFSHASGYTWRIATASGGIDGFSAGSFLLDSSRFTNDVAGGSFRVEMSEDGRSLYLVFAPAAPRRTAPHGAVHSMRLLANRAVALQFAGVPTCTYDVERTTNLSGNVWTVIFTTNAPEGGAWGFVDNDPPLLTAFYRTRQR